MCHHVDCSGCRHLALRRECGKVALHRQLLHRNHPLVLRQSGKNLNQVILEIQPCRLMLGGREFCSFGESMHLQRIGNCSVRASLLRFELGRREPKSWKAFHILRQKAIHIGIKCITIVGCKGAERLHNRISVHCFSGVKVLAPSMTAPVNKLLKLC